MSIIDYRYNNIISNIASIIIIILLEWNNSILENRLDTQFVTIITFTRNHSAVFFSRI